MDVHTYIISNWEKTIRDPKKEKGNLLPNKYSTPCIEGIFTNFYYWDTYFINLGLLKDNKIKEARNNLKIMKYFVNTYGYVPNADHILTNSQPPLFTLGVYDLYKKTNDIKDITSFIEELLIEYNFWMTNRITKCGLNQYKYNEDYIKDTSSYDYFVNRVGGLKGKEKEINHLEMVKNFFAIAESGWDMNYRYLTISNRFASLEFISIDLNSILYNVEIKISEMLSILKRNKEADEFNKKAIYRKNLINKLMMNKDHLFLDYNFINKKHSLTISSASFLPYAMSVNNDKEGCLKLFKLLDNEFGISSATDHKENIYMQWDYPSMWPSNVYFAYLALKNTGNIKEAEIIKKQYLSTVEKVFNKTNKLWEKYNTLTGDISYSIEYETPSMMGWTAGVYEFFRKKCK